MASYSDSEIRRERLALMHLLLSYQIEKWAHVKEKRNDGAGNLRGTPLSLKRMKSSGVTGDGDGQKKGAGFDLMIIWL